jgi:hypothetical protein
MHFRRILLCTSVVLGMAATAPVFADDIIVTVPPPALQTEAIPPTRTGYVWSPGYWQWQSNRGEYAWVPGRWLEVRAKSHWVPEQWEKLSDNRWKFSPGHWETD